ncbi:MAG TPA: type II secretion system F family protein [Bacillales bacterium]|nr:type II secretion system F family protein [Bacillales bacterium]
MAVFALIAIFLLIIYALIWLKASKDYQPFIGGFQKDEFSLHFMAPVSLYLLDRFKIIERFYGRISMIQQKIMKLHGHKEAIPYTKMFVAQLISVVLIGFLATCLMAYIGNGDQLLFIAGIAMTAFMPAFMIKRLSDKEKKRNDAIVMELPELLNKMILLVNAGETVQLALIRCVGSKEDSNHPLYNHLREVVNKLTNNESFPLVMNNLSKSCGIQEVSIFSTTVLLNYRKGGQDLVLSLRELSQDLWRKRKAISKSKGEEASSKLVFPLVLIFLAVLIIVGWPAMQMM